MGRVPGAHIIGGPRDGLDLRFRHADMIIYYVVCPIFYHFFFFFFILRENKKTSPLDYGVRLERGNRSYFDDAVYII